MLQVGVSLMGHNGLRARTYTAVGKGQCSDNVPAFEVAEFLKLITTLAI